MKVTVISHRMEVMSAEKQAKERALEICGGKAESYAKMGSPTKTGRLKNSFAHEQRGENTEVIGSDVEYAVPVELGHRQQPGRYVPAIGKRLVADHVEGKFMLTHAIQDHVSEYQHICEQELGKLS